MCVNIIKLTDKINFIYKRFNLSSILLIIYYLQLTELPIQIGQLKVIRELKIRNNMLTQLPQNIGTLNKLEFLDVAENNLQFLPAMIQYLTLSTIDLSGNLLFQNYDIIVNNSISDMLPSLVELSAKQVLKSRFLLFLFFSLCCKCI